MSEVLLFGQQSQFDLQIRLQFTRPSDVSMVRPPHGGKGQIWYKDGWSTGDADGTTLAPSFLQRRAGF
jgi:hypothetical protein